MQKFWLALRKSDKVLLAATFLLFILGVIILYSVNLSMVEAVFPLYAKQLIYFLIGLIFMGFFMSVDYRLWQPLYPWFYLAALFLLLLIYTPFGENIRGIRAWLDFGVFVWQPVELVKILLIFSLAGYFSKQGRHLRTWKPLFVSGTAVLLLVGLIVVQPDFGSAMIVFLLWLGLVLILGLSKWQIALMMMVFVSVALFSWVFVLQDFQKDRLLTFVDPAHDPLGSGYNLTQSIIAIGSGGLIGRGIGYGSQSQLRFLPETQSDFVFAVLGEELGLAGIFLLLVLLGIFAWRFTKIAYNTNNDFGQVMIVGITITLIGQACVNIAMNMGLTPVTGISLPFISSGGSYLLAVMIMIGLVQSVKVHT